MSDMRFVIIGIVLVKGAKGDWDNKVKPEDKVGPDRNQSDDD